jgi:hypothetical protein
MANSNKVFVSPGVYTSEKDLTFVAQSVGVTTLGLAGETLKGPAFEPVLITDFDEFKTYFGTTSPEKYGNGNPKYELAYVAKAYLQESNQLFVTRVLGLTGFKPNKTFGIKTIAGISWDSTETPVSTSGTLIPTLTGVTGSTFYSVLSGKTATTGDSVTEFIVSGTYTNGDWFTIGVVPEAATASETGTQLTSPIGDYTNQNWYNNFYTTSGGNVNGLYSYLFHYSGASSTFVVTRYNYTGTTSNNYGDITVAALRPRGNYSTETLGLEITANSGFTITSDSLTTNPLAEFTINTVGSTSGTKEFTCSLDTTSSKYITKVLGTDVFDKKRDEVPVYVHEVYPSLINTLYEQGLILGLSLDEVYHSVGTDFVGEWDTPASPMVVSEVRGGKVSDLFQVFTVSDGNAANYQVKITLLNIDLDTAEFDILVRDFNDTDDNMVVLEKFTRCTMDSTLPGYVARKVGTQDGEYELRSKYIMLVMADEHPEDAIPAGFKGFVADNLAGSTSVIGAVKYKTKFFDAGDETGAFSLSGEPTLSAQGDKPKKTSLGLSSQVGFDSDLLKYKGVAPDAVTVGFHLSSNASSITGNTITGKMFDCTPYDLEGTDKGKLASTSYRKFTFAVCGGFDGWDIYRSSRTNSDGYVFGKKTYVSGHTTNGGVFSTSVGNSDYYAFLKGIETYSNPEAVDINIFATPGINFDDHNSLVTQAIDIIENDRADSLYIINSPNVSTADEITDLLDSANLDTNYSATYWPWIQVRDNDNSTQLWLPPTGEVVRNIALTDNVSYPWFAVAGYSRGLVNSIKAYKKLTLDERDSLYKNRINPIATFSDTGTIIWGNKTLQVRESALDRINVRRLLLRARKLISAVAVRLLFEQNDEQVRQEFLRLVNPILESIKKERGLYDFRVTVSSDPEDIDANTLRGKIYIKPTRSLEFIDVEFIITPTGASFENI